MSPETHNAHIKATLARQPRTLDKEQRSTLRNVNVMKKREIGARIGMGKGNKICQTEEYGLIKIRQYKMYRKQSQGKERKQRG